MKVIGDEKREAVFMKVSGWGGIWNITVAGKKKKLRIYVAIETTKKYYRNRSGEKESEQGKNSFSWQRGK